MRCPYKEGLAQTVVDDVGHETHDVLHLKANIFKMLPLLGLFPIVHHDVGLVWGRRASKADPPWTPVLELFLRVLLDAPDELLHHLERASMAQKQVDERGESPIIINSAPGPGLVRLATTRGPGLIFPASTRSSGHVLPWLPTLNIAWGNPLNDIEGPLNL